MDSLCHSWFTTTKLSYRFPILKLPPPPCAVLLVCVHRKTNGFGVEEHPKITGHQSVLIINLGPKNNGWFKKWPTSTCFGFRQNPDEKGKCQTGRERTAGKNQKRKGKFLFWGSGPTKTRSKTFRNCMQLLSLAVYPPVNQQFVDINIYTVYIYIYTYIYIYM